MLFVHKSFSYEEKKGNRIKTNKIKTAMAEGEENCNGRGGRRLQWQRGKKKERNEKKEKTNKIKTTLLKYWFFFFKKNVVPSFNFFIHTVFFSNLRNLYALRRKIPINQKPIFCSRRFCTTRLP